MVKALAHPCVFPVALKALVALFPLFGVYDGQARVPGRAGAFQTCLSVPNNVACRWLVVGYSHC